ncbi:hypothetical protein F5Y17DRAFT_454869 [Xylariaceae sp. FL0594]|nr:hypothetical protein F5Y17DRAFT_454869 [Xylariaceae sp. FL0594]
MDKDMDIEMVDAVYSKVATTGLLDMPVEIILEISSYLEKKDRIALRATSEKLDAITFMSFVGDYFYEVQVNCSVDDMKMLSQISKSRLRQHVKRLTIGIYACPKEEYPQVQMAATSATSALAASAISSWEYSRRNSARTICRFFLADALLRIEPETLTMAYGFQTPWRKPGKTWRYLWSVSPRRSFTPLLHGGYEINKMAFEPRAAIMVVLEALAIAQPKKQRSGGSLIRQLNFFLGPVSLEVLSSIPTAIVSTALGSLLSLYLNLDGVCRCRNHNRANYHRWMLNNWPYGTDVYHLHSFLSWLPQLLALQLSYHCMPNTFHTVLPLPPPPRWSDGTFHMIPTPAPPSSFSPMILVGRLTNLTIYSAFVDPKDLLRALVNLSSTLEYLVLVGVRFGPHQVPFRPGGGDLYRPPIQFVQGLILKLSPERRPTLLEKLRQRNQQGMFDLPEVGSVVADGQVGSNNGVAFKLRHITFARSPFIFDIKDESDQGHFVFDRFTYTGPPVGSSTAGALMIFLDLLRRNIYTRKDELESLDLFELGIEGVIRMGPQRWGPWGHEPTPTDIVLRGRPKTPNPS